VGDKVGIVFGGGGGKGAYQIGVWRALDELGVCSRIQGVSGASVGALNGAMFCAGNLNQAVSAWSSINENSILAPNDMGKMIVKNRYNGWFSNSGLRELIKKYVDLSTPGKGRIVFYAVASRIKKPVYFNVIRRYSDKNILHKIISALFIITFKWVASAQYFKVNDYEEKAAESIILASAAIPLVFPDIVIDGDTYVDGGLKDNVPIFPLYNAGFRKFIVVALNEDYKIQTQAFPDAEFLELSLKEDTLKGIEGTFDFTAEDARQKMQQGYEDCTGVLDAIVDFIK